MKADEIIYKGQMPKKMSCSTHLSLASMLVMGVKVMLHGGKGIKIMLGLCPYRLRKRI